MGGVVNKGEALVRDAHCYTDKVVKEVMVLCSFVITATEQQPPTSGTEHGLVRV